MFFPVAQAQAVNGPTITNLQAMDLTSAIYMLVALAILAAGALSIIFIFFGGFSFIVSGGDETKVKNALHTIRYAIIGLVVTLLSIVSVQAVGRLFNVNFNFLDIQSLSAEMNILVNRFHQQAPTVVVPAATSNAGTTTVNPTGVKQNANIVELTR